MIRIKLLYFSNIFFNSILILIQLHRIVVGNRKIKSKNRYFIGVSIIFLTV